MACRKVINNQGTSVMVPEVVSTALVAYLNEKNDRMQIQMLTYANTVFPEPAAHKRYQLATAPKLDTR